MLLFSVCVYQQDVLTLRFFATPLLPVLNELMPHRYLQNRLEVLPKPDLNGSAGTKRSLERYTSCNRLTTLL